jgi:hypothetical protein
MWDALRALGGGVASRGVSVACSRFIGLGESDLYLASRSVLPVRGGWLVERHNLSLDAADVEYLTELGGGFLSTGLSTVLEVLIKLKRVDL